MSGASLRSLLLLTLGLASGTLASFLVVLHGFSPAHQRARAAWRAYQQWADRQLRALWSPLRARDLAVRHVGAIAIALVAGVALGSWLWGLLLAAVAAYLPVLWLARERKRRARALDAQLDATLQSMANTILVTQNLEDAFATIAQHFDAPMSQEADVVVKEARLGTPMDEALRHFGARCRSRNVDAMVTALTVGQKTGGELPKVLETTATVLRETMRVEGVMESKTSEGKAQVVVMGIMPFLFGGALQLIDPEWMQPLFRDPIGWALLAGACVLEAIGLGLTHKLSRIDV
jgi:tight adherence protein B